MKCLLIIKALSTFYSKQLNLRQKIWLEFIKDYELDIQYCLGKANIVADALSHKSITNVNYDITQQS